MFWRCAGAWPSVCVSVMDAAVCGWVRKEVVLFLSSCWKYFGNSSTVLWGSQNDCREGFRLSALAQLWKVFCD